MRARRLPAAALLPALALAAAGCNPNWEPGERAREKPPKWDRPPMAGDDAHGHGGSGGGGVGRSRMPSMASIVEELQRKVDADPSDVESARQLGQALSEIGEWDRAAQVLQEALAAAPQDVELRVLRARVLISRRDQGAALAELEEARKIAPDDERVLRAWGSYWILAEDMEKAVETRRRLLEKHPGVEDAETIEREIYYLARFPKLKEQGTLKEFFDVAGAAKAQVAANRWDEAVRSLTRVLEILPDDPEHWTSLGVAQRRTGKKADGTASLRKALSLDRNHAPARLELARALSEDGDAGGAITVLAEWRKLDAKRAVRHGAGAILARLEKGEPFEEPPGGGASTSAGAPGEIRGVVRIAPALASRLPPNPSLFVIAKKQPGDRMPAAVKRMVGATLPAEFTLSPADSMAGGELDGEVFLSARVEVDGKMGSGPGDLEGAVATAVPVGSGGIEIVIDTEIGAAKAPPAMATPAAAAGGSGRITGTISLAPGLAAKVPPGATLYIFAKANPGPGAPIAVVRRPVPAFPFEFQLSSADSMMQGVPFEGNLYLTARIDQDGAAGATPGDLEGVTMAPVPVGSEGVSLTIDTVR